MIPGVCHSCYSFFNSPFCWEGTEIMTILMVLVLMLQPNSRDWAQGRRCSALHSVHVHISCLFAGSAGVGRESERVFFQNKGKDECTCLISCRQLNMSSFPLPLIPKPQPVERLTSQKSSTAISRCMSPVSRCLYYMVPELFQPLGTKAFIPRAHRRVKHLRTERKETTPSLLTNPASSHRTTPSNQLPEAAVAHLEPQQRQLSEIQGCKKPVSPSGLQAFGLPWTHNDLTCGTSLRETFYLDLNLKAAILVWEGSGLFPFSYPPPGAAM